MEKEYNYAPDEILTIEEYEASGDLGLRVKGPNLPAAIAAAVQGLVAAILPSASIEPLETQRIEASGKDDEELVVNFLNSIIFLIYGQKWIPNRLEKLSLRSHGALEAILIGEKMDPKRHRIDREIKAVTYHNLSIKKNPQGVTIDLLCDL